MLFNSFEFVIFFCIVFFIYYKSYNNLKFQNILLLVSSYIFYGWWDWKFLTLIVISSLSDYIIGKAIDESDNKKKRKQLLILSLTINLGILGFFKYYNFFSQSFSDFVALFGFETNPFLLNIVLPVGISFYTFQTMSYTIDIYKGKMKSNKNLLEFMTFVSFFPQLVAGPIERASHLLPQFSKKRTFNLYEFKEGAKQGLWGLFKKIVIADNCAFYANQIFENSDSYPGSVLVIGVILFAFQIYGDFSGYSDIAIGISRMMGIDLMQNFKSPYLSENIQDFWRRWHISLSTWFRDYVYIPLGGSKVDSSFRRSLNIIITFTVSGFWHGANWTFIIWGALHSLFYFIQTSYSRNMATVKILPEKFVKFFSILITFIAVTFAWIFFRADSFSHAISYISEIISSSILTNPMSYIKTMGSTVKPFIIVIGLIYLSLFEIFNRDSNYSFQVGHFRAPVRTVLYSSLILLIIFFRATGGAIDFIYFQF
ncbi:MBOAT family O-acyltransferase [uncultured Winogradskyella sp.]|uniref:MBOAT family O-acyltransferase n=1 Tax=uncultured Winogradskyella sp. TaxID=395353 RepID=UPI0026260425|nr:MBOAT family O-acyltransferase [uncultured Winogradskyella sp.]|tara:strand:+ start:226 stop:1674 length:1449 start_codon:yes stop_codon:yes gene_type:complete